MNKVIIDVRERDEFEAEHVEHSINVPLSHFAAVAPGVLNQLSQKEIWIFCRGGNRAKLALDQLKQMGYSDKVSASVFEGGILEWIRQGKPTVQKRKNHLPILRQVQLFAGVSVVISSLLGAFMSPWYLGLTVFFGAGITLAGATGYCGLANLIALMPWNRNVSSTNEELRQVSSSLGG